jgi:hypothetical protein
VAANRDEAMAWFQKAAAQGNAAAREELGKLGAATPLENLREREKAWPAVKVTRDEPELRPPIFILGCGHSGTSLLVRVLGAHSRIAAIPFESNFALKWPASCRESQQFFAHAEKYTRAMGKARWLEKTPRHIYRIAEILRYFPEAKIVLMIRDGRDVACSIRDRYGSLEAGIHRWVEDNEAGRKFWTHPNVRVVRYEELVADFEKTVREIVAFVGEEFEEGMLRFHETAQYFFASRIEKPRDIFGENHELYRNWQINQPLFDGRGKWRQMTEEEKRLVKAKAYGMLAELGYGAQADW